MPNLYLVIYGYERIEGKPPATACHQNPCRIGLISMHRWESATKAEVLCWITAIRRSDYSTWKVEKPPRQQKGVHGQHSNGGSLVHSRHVYCTLMNQCEKVHEIRYGIRNFDHRSTLVSWSWCAAVLEKIRLIEQVWKFSQQLISSHFFFVLFYFASCKDCGTSDINLSRFINLNWCKHPGRMLRFSDTPGS